MYFHEGKKNYLSTIQGYNILSDKANFDSLCEWMRELRCSNLSNVCIVVKVWEREIMIQFNWRFVSFLFGGFDSGLLEVCH